MDSRLAGELVEQRAIKSSSRKKVNGRSPVWDLLQSYCRIKRDHLEASNLGVINPHPDPTEHRTRRNLNQLEWLIDVERCMRSVLNWNEIKSLIKYTLEGADGEPYENARYAALLWDEAKRRGLRAR